MTTLTNTLEGGTPPNTITAANSGGASGTAFAVSSSGGGARVFQSTNAIKGSVSARLTAAAGTDTVTLGWDNLFSGVTGTGWTFRYYITPLADTSANGATICQIRNASAAAGTIVMNTGLSIRLTDFGGTVIAGSITALSLNTVYRIEGNIDPGTSTTTGTCVFQVFLGDSTTPITNTSATGRNFNSATITGARWGKTGTTGSVDYLLDAVTANDTSGTTLPGPLVNTAPTVSVTTPVTIAAGGTAALASTESDPQGDPITGTWAYLSGPVNVAPAAPSSASTTVTLSTPGRYVYRRSVSDGSLTTTGDVAVRVTATPVQPDSTLSNAGGAVSVGAATKEAALSDSNDSTYAESVSSPSAAVYVYQLAPMTVPTDKSAVKLVVRARYASATSASAKFELLEGATVRKDFGSQALTNAFANYTLALDLTSANAITDWSNLSVRQTDTAS